MKTAAKTTNGTSAEIVKVVSVIDVVGALATEQLDGSIYFLDTNKLGGSVGQGTETLKTAVKLGDILVWVSQSLEVEAFASIASIEIDESYCKPKQGTFEGTDITYWYGKVKKVPGEAAVPYNIQFKLGSRVEPMPLSAPKLPSLIRSKQG